MGGAATVKSLHCDGKRGGEKRGVAKKRRGCKGAVSNRGEKTTVNITRL